MSHIKVSAPKKRVMDTCSICIERNPSQSKGHRNGSACPYHEDYCKTCMTKGIVTNKHSTSKCPNNDDIGSSPKLKKQKEKEKCINGRYNLITRKEKEKKSIKKGS